MARFTGAKSPSITQPLSTATRARCGASAPVWADALCAPRLARAAGLPPRTERRVASNVAIMSPSRPGARASSRVMPSARSSRPPAMLIARSDGLAKVARMTFDVNGIGRAAIIVARVSSSSCP
ncbi:MAG: hypothetical protein CK531_06360 [Gemmatimonadetes bacterium]|nr:MAG: hypothetical protein CK531_06360 [Gemmatimonadota bacterium]